MLGALSRGTRIASNVDACLEAARGKPILFFPARFDSYLTQAADGYAYRTAVEAYNARHGASSPVRVSTHAQATWWGGRGGGTIAHAYVLCFLADTAESALQFARLMPPEAPRIALVDTNNDCVTDSLRTARTLFEQFYRLTREGRGDEAERYRLHGVRPDTSERLRDVAVEALGDARLDCGVTPRLVTAMREALDAEGERITVAEADRDLARAWFRGVGVVVTGGFNPERIALFERLGVPVASYGVGSSLLRGPSNDFTADIVAVEHQGAWHELAKVGRGRVENPGLERVELPLP
jgi:nicotinate phosphoribosyltransferase